MGHPIDQRVMGIVLAGVHIWEDSAFNNATLRPLLPVADRPLISHVLDWLRLGGVSRATICANSTSRFVRRYLGSGSQLDMHLDYYEDWTPRGPAGCIKDAALDTSATCYLVVDGTMIPQVDIQALLDAHRRSQAWLTIVVTQSSRQGGPRQNPLKPVGIYVFDRRAMECISQIGYQDIKEVVIPRLHETGGKISTYLAEGSCPRVSGLQSYRAISKWLVERIGAEVHDIPGYRRVGFSRVHRDAYLDPQARLIGTVLIASGARIHKDATVVGPSVIGAGSTIEAGAIVCRSILWDGCRVGKTSAVDDCVLGYGARVEAHARLYGTFHAPPATAGDGLRERLQTWAEHPASPVADAQALLGAGRRDPTKFAPRIAPAPAPFRKLLSLVASRP